MLNACQAVASHMNLNGPSNGCCRHLNITRRGEIVLTSNVLGALFTVGACVGFVQAGATPAAVGYTAAAAACFLPSVLSVMERIVYCVNGQLAPPFYVP